MCDECRQNPCDARCPNNTKEEREYCCICDEVLEFEDAYTDGAEYICECCFEEMHPVDIARRFNIPRVWFDGSL